MSTEHASKHWLALAQQALNQAALSSAPEVRDVLTAIAAEYLKLAEMADGPQVQLDSTPHKPER